MQLQVETKNEKDGSSAGRKNIYIGQDIFDKILLRIPLKPLARFKCVSKSWCKQIEAVRASQWQPKSSCLLLNFWLFSCNTIFLCPRDHGEECIEINEVNVPGILIDSRDGMHLYEGTKSKDFYLTDTAHKLFWKFASFPDDFAVASGYLGSLFPDNVRCFCITHASDHETKMMCFTIGDKNAAEGKIKYYIFSSHKEEWRSSEARLLNSHRMSDSIVDIASPSRCPINLNGVVCGRELYWLFRRFMLVYQSDEECFRAVELPGQKARRRGGLIWQSEGILNYCNLNRSGLYIWTFKPDKDSEEKWKLKETVEMEKLQRRTREITGLEQSFIYRAVVFSDELQVVYLEAPLLLSSFLLSYSLETGDLSKAWTFHSSLCRGFTSQ